jgi:hypothetical protein
MIRISVTHEENTLCFKVEGRLAGVGVDELRGAILRRDPNCEFELDIAEATFVDEDGEKLLLWIDRLGGRFRTSGVYSNFLLQRLDINSLAQQRTDTHNLSLRLPTDAALAHFSQRTPAAGR